MNTISIIIILLTFIGIWRKIQQTYVERKFKYNMYKLRDELRELAINNAIPAKSWIFDYYDNSFSKAISQSYYLTIFRLAVLEKKYTQNKEFEEFKQKVDAETTKYQDLIKIREDYFLYVKKYLMNQHFVTMCTFMIPIITAIIGSAFIIMQAKKLIKNTIFFPETSDSNGYLGIA